MTKEERRQVLEKVRTELDEEVRNIREPVLTPMGYLMWFVRVGSTEPTNHQKHLKNCFQSINSELLPKNQARTNLYTSEQGYPRSITIGLT
eukprot:2512999-Amphidinium_carterae.1